MGLFARLFGRKRPDPPPPPAPSADGGAEPTGLLAQMFLGPLLATVKATGADLRPGEFFLCVVEHSAQATAAVQNLGLFGVSDDGPRKLAVMAYGGPGGSTVLRGEGRDGRLVDLAAVQEPAILYVPRETVAWMKRDPGVWGRIKNPEGGDAPTDRPATATSPPPPPPPSAEPELPPEASPFAGAEDAAALQQVLVSACCEYNDGSGDVRGAALRELFKGFRAAHVAAPLAASGLKQLARLLEVVRRITTRLRDKNESAPKGLDEFRTAAVRAARDGIAQGADAADVFEVVSPACMQYDDGSGSLYSSRARVLFDGVDAGPLAAPLAESKLRDLNNLRRALDLIAADLGSPRCGGLEQVRTAVARAADATLVAVAADMPAAEDAEQLRRDIARACTRYDDGSGHVYPWAVRTVFEPFDPDRARPALAGSGVRSLTKLYALLRGLGEDFDRPCPGLDRCRQAVLDALRANLAQVATTGDLSDAIAHVATRYSDGSGEVRPRDVRALLRGFDPKPLFDLLADGKRSELDKLDTVLTRVAEGVGKPAIPEFDELRAVVARARQR